MTISFSEIYLDSNATTPVLPAAMEAVRQAMAAGYGNPSSVHCSGLRAKALMESVRASASRVLGAGSGRVLFVSGATEGIQTAILSALVDVRERRDRGEPIGRLLLYGATEHKAVPNSLAHWNRVLGLNLDVLAIPVGVDGLHDLRFLRRHAGESAMVCTMAANNETGVISDLDGTEALLAETASTARWMVDGVQALGKLPLRLAQTRIDYAPFSGHKLNAPKGIGLLYVRDGAPFTPLMAGGGQEGGQRSGTENVVGMAGLGAVLRALEEGGVFHDRPTLEGYRSRIAAALTEAFPSVCFNAPFEASLPTTLSFSVEGFASKELLDLFDAAQIRVSSGSACSSNKAVPSYVLQAMGLPEWRAASVVRLSFSPSAESAFIDAACDRIRACGAAVRRSCLVPSELEPLPGDGVIQLNSKGACTWIVTDAGSRTCVVIDPVAELCERIENYVRCQGSTVLAVLDTHSHADHASPRVELLSRLGERSAPAAARSAEPTPRAPGGAGGGAPPPNVAPSGSPDVLGWPEGTGSIELADGGAAPCLRLGARVLARAALPGHTADSVGYLLGTPRDGRLGAADVRLAFTGDNVLIGGLGRTDFATSSSAAQLGSLHRLAALVTDRTLLAPAHDYGNQLATTLEVEKRDGSLLGRALAPMPPMTAEEFAREKDALDRRIDEPTHQVLVCGAVACPPPAAESVHVRPGQLGAFLRSHPAALLVDVREPHEHAMTPAPELGEATIVNVPMSRLAGRVPDWLNGDSRPLVFFCRSGNRSMQAASCLRRLGHAEAWHLAGGLAQATGSQATGSQATA